MKKLVSSTFVVAAAAFVAAAPAGATHQDPNVGDQYGNPAPTPVKPGTFIRPSVNRLPLSLGRGDVLRLPNVRRVRRGMILVLRDRNGTRVTIVAGRNAIVRRGSNGLLVIRMIRPGLFTRGTRAFVPRGMRIVRSAGVYR